MGEGKSLYAALSSHNWRQLFPGIVDYREDRSMIQVKNDLDTNGIDTAGNDLASVLQISENSAPCCMTNEIRRFCAPLSQCVDDSDLVIRRGDYQPKRVAWLDERGPSDLADDVREQHNPLTTADLYHSLRQPWFNHPILPDVRRRIILITELDPAGVIALIKTTPYFQAKILRRVIYNYLTSKVSMRVRTSVTTGKPIFHLDLHIPYFTLREGVPVVDSQTGELPENWTDLSFLDISKAQSHGQSYGMYESKFSMAICGLSDSLWTCYCFVDNDFDYDELQSEEGSTYVGFQTDPLGLSDESVDANAPIRNPRDYQFLIFKRRMKRIVAEYRNLIDAIDKGVKKYEQLTASTGHVKDFKGSAADLVRVQKMNGVLRKLRAHLGKTVDGWRKFDSPVGDIRWFEDLLAATDDLVNDTTCRVGFSLLEIREDFKDLEDLQEALSDLEHSTDESAHILGLKLAAKQNRSARQNELTGELSVMVFAPITITFAYFNLPENIIPFKISQSSFNIVLAISMLLALLINYLPRHPGWRGWIAERLTNLQDYRRSGVEKPRSRRQQASNMVSETLELEDV